MFKERIVKFRMWMKEKGYQDTPLYVSEYGVLMPADFGFDVPRVNQFMNDSFDYMLTATDPDIGYPRDGYRLAQRWSWYSTVDQLFNGYLFEIDTGAMTEMGLNYRNYALNTPNEVDISLSSFVILQSPDADTVHVTAQNHGSNPSLRLGGVPVRIYAGNPDNGGVLLDTFEIMFSGGNSVGYGSYSADLSAYNLADLYVELPRVDQEMCLPENATMSAPTIIQADGERILMPIVRR